MNFTREPIIETVITPRDGCKLVVRSSKGVSQEDYIVDAVEVVSFGHSFFFRSQERPKSFLVPVSDYEILESKETRMVLKNVTSDRAIKISGGAQPRPEPQDETYTDSRPAPERSQGQHDRKHGNNKRRRGRRGRDRHHEPHHPQEVREPQEQHHHEASQEAAEPHFEEPHENGETFPEGSEPPKAPSFISKLFPPPPTLIKDSLSRYKPAETVEESFSITEETTFEETDSPKDLEDDNEE